MTRRAIAGYAVAGVFAVLAAWSITTAVLGLAGKATATTNLACDRQQGECRSVFPLRTIRYSLANLTGAELLSSRRSLGRGARFESQYAIGLRFKDAPTEQLGSWTADADTVARYKDAIARIEAFVARSEPALAIEIAGRDSATWNWRAILDGALCLVVAGVLVYLVRRRAR